MFSSSATVYGQPEKVPCFEDSPLKALNPYGRTKVNSLHTLCQKRLPDTHVAEVDSDGHRSDRQLI